MDTITERVRSMYERFPYPAGAPVFRQGVHARLLLSRVRRQRSGDAPLTVLDAGCGRGVGLVAAAALQPDVQFTGIDLSRPSLEDARSEVARRGLRNVRLQCVDLMTLDGLEVPSGGFDVILSSGVVHHLADPSKGLALLAKTLAPHGVLSLMVYGRHGRESLRRLVESIDLLIPRTAPLEERLRVGRELVAQAPLPAVRIGPSADLDALGDVEFVDRYLNVNETSYDVEDLFALVESAGLSFLRWCEPADWEPLMHLPDGPLRDRVRGLSHRARAGLMERWNWLPRLEALWVAPGNGPRPALDLRSTAGEWVAISPEASLERVERFLGGTSRLERLALRVRRAPPLPIQEPILGDLLIQLADRPEPTPLAELLEEFASRGYPGEAVGAAIRRLEALDAIYRPRPKCGLFGVQIAIK
jgi:SAM-dependent methyltransferase